MSAINDGGPAFPYSEIDQISGQIHDQYKGMSLRMWLAAQAPAVPDWFKHTPSSPAPHAPEPYGLSAAQRAELASEHADESRDAEVVGFLERLARHKAEIGKWRDEQREMKFFAWRFHYADAMIKAGAK